MLPPRGAWVIEATSISVPLRNHKILRCTNQPLVRLDVSVTFFDVKRRSFVSYKLNIFSDSNNSFQRPNIHEY